MDPRERVADPQLALMAALDGRQANIWTALPGIIDGFSASSMTVDVKPAILGAYRLPNGKITQVEMPLLKKCPVQLPRAGGFSITFPVAAGDECLVIFASRCIDAWWQSGGVQPPAEYRMHDLSDGFALLGYCSQPRAIEQYTTTGMRLRTDDPDLSYIELTKDGRIVMYAKEGFFFTTPSPNGFGFSGDMGVVGTIRGSEVISTQRNVRLNSHTHSGITVGGSNTQQPVSGS